MIEDKPTVSHLSWRSISVEVETVLAVVFIVEIVAGKAWSIGVWAYIAIPLEFGQVILLKS